MRSRALIFTGNILLLSAFLLGLRGYNFATNVHHDQVLPFILRLLHPAAFPGDPYVASYAYYPSLFPRLAALAARACGGLPRAMAALYTINLLGMAAAVLWLVDQCLDDRKEKTLAVALIASSAFLNSRSFFGDDAMFRSYVDASTLAWAPLLGAMALWIRGSRRAGWLLVGLAANLNPLPALHVGLVFLIAWTFSEKGPWRPAVGRLFPGLVLAGAAALPLAVRLARMPAPLPVDGAAVLGLLKAWYPFHYFPETWPPGKWLLAFPYVALYAGLLMTAPEKTRRRLLAPGYGVAALLALGFAARGIGSFRLIRLQFFRADVLAVLFGTLLTAQRAIGYFRQGMLRSSLAGALLVSTVTIWFSWPLACVALGALVLEEHPPRTGVRWAFWSAVIVAACWSVNASADGRATLFSPYVALGLFIASLGMLAGPMELTRRGRLFLSVGLTGVLFLPLSNLLTERVRRGDLDNLEGDHLRFEREWKEVGAWCREHTPEDAVFLAPPEMWGFRSVSGRSVVFQWVDGSAMHWDPAFADTWKERLADFQVTPEAMLARWDSLARTKWYPVLAPSSAGDPSVSPLEKAYDRLSPEEIRRLARLYRAGYFLGKAEAPSLPFPVILQGRYYRLYRLPAPSS